MAIGRQKWPKGWLAESPGKRCPNCGERSGRPILRGMPTSESFDAAEDGTIDVIFGGCIVGPDDPGYQCRSCGMEFG